MGKKVKKESETPPKETFEPQSVECKNPATVVLLLKSPEEDILIKACDAVYTFAEKGEENKISLLGLGTLEPLSQLINHNNKLIKRNACMALGIMATNSDVTNALKNLNVIPSITDKLSPKEDEVVHEFATLCLAALSVDFVCKAQIFDNNGLPPLIQLLSSPDPDIKKNSLETVFNMVQNHPSCQAVHELGGIPPLLELLKSEFPVIQHLALKTLRDITVDNDTRGTFRKEQGFKELLDILDNVDFNDLHAEALQVVTNCLNDSESLQLIHGDGGLTRLLHFVLTPTSPEIQASAVKCITKVARNPEYCGLLHKQNVEKVLVELLSVADTGVRAAACQAVAAMCVHPSSKDTFRDLGGVTAVVELLRDESLEVKEAATQALSDLTYNNQPNALAVFEAGGHEILVQQLYGSCSRTAANSAATLGTMAEQEVIRCSISSHGAVRALAELLRSTDTNVLLNTMQCLQVLACDAEARAVVGELQSAGGLEPLVNLLHSHHKEVLQNACLAISVCATDEPTAVEMCRFGALEMLQEINESTNRKSSFSKLAMAALLNSNLSVKYSLTGHLTSSDNISDGFYDAGKAREGQRTLSLEELAKEPVNQDLPVIAVNTATEEKKESNKQRDEPLPESPTEKPWKMMDDISLQHLIKEAKESILPLSDEREQYAALARLVSEAMGGAVEMEKMHKFPWVLHLRELKFKLQSNVVPIGLIRMGIYRHRALLFKCLVDSFGMSCTLVRGEYSRGWNEVLLFEGTGNNSQPCRYIVDLMHHPGDLLRVNSPAAIQYQTI